MLLGGYGKEFIDENAAKDVIRVPAFFPPKTSSVLPVSARGVCPAASRVLIQRRLVLVVIVPWVWTRSLPLPSSATSISDKVMKIYERIEEYGRKPLLVHPETIVFDTRGTMYIMNEHAKLVSLTDVAPKTDDGNVDGSNFTSETT